MRALLILICLMIVFCGDLLATGVMGPVGDEGARIRIWFTRSVGAHTISVVDGQRVAPGEVYTTQRQGVYTGVRNALERFGGGIVALICAGFFFVQRQRTLVEDYPSKR